MLLKKDSVLAWAGEGYDLMKLTPENFLNFYYKETHVLKKVTENKYSYVVNKILRMRVTNFGLEGLPFKSSYTFIKMETNINILIEKNLFNFQLAEFAKIVMEFWHYFKLETYYENYRLVFKVNQTVFYKVLERAGVLEQNSEVSDIISIFNPIINFFKSEISSNLTIRNFNIKFSRYTINIINKTEKSFTVKLLRKIANINSNIQNNILY
ncbi:hypothetical protein [Spiroplasma endosymbiont of Ammophila pubescens]|uniref:hypothetical protein n=1 Tax=Spiroplasma endosymbiont of Ammophila pubescens TaxID=3066315 RepID=UPI0032B17C1F